MELKACILALRWIRKNAPWPGVTRVQIITDSMYVKDNIWRTIIWRRNGWRNVEGEPKQNINLWKEFLSLYPQRGITVTIQQTKGKKDKELKVIDTAAKAAAKRGGVNIDRGYQKGRIVRSALPGVATRLEARGQELIMRPYAKKVMERTNGENRIKFDIFSEEQGTYIAKRYAFASPELALDLHCPHGYRVRCNDSQGYPQILAPIIEEVKVPKVSQPKKG